MKMQSKVIRLWRSKTLKEKGYRIVVMYKSSRSRGKIIDILGYYDPKGRRFGLNTWKLCNWYSRGVVIRDSVYRVLSKIKH